MRPEGQPATVTERGRMLMIFERRAPITGCKTKDFAKEAKKTRQNKEKRRR